VYISDSYLVEYGLKEEEANMSRPMEGESRKGTWLTYIKKNWSIRSAISIMLLSEKLKSLFTRLKFNIIVVIQGL